MKTQITPPDLFTKQNYGQAPSQKLLAVEPLNSSLKLFQM